MNIPIDIQFDFIWITLAISFIVLPLILLIFKRWLIVVIQTAIIASLSMFVSYLSFTGIDMDSNSLYTFLFYTVIGVYISLGIYGLIDGVHKAVKG